MPITFPPPPGTDLASCVWTGEGFSSGNWQTRVLSYETGQSGWTDDLTRFHEETAGADHYIDIASRENALRCLKRYTASASPVVMDVGCSSGLFLELLRDRFPESKLIGADYVRGPLEALSKRLPRVPLLQFDLAACPLPDNFVDAVVALNVLEHIEDDVSAMKHVHRILKPGGIAVLEVPAGPMLYDLYDRELMHFRRYRMSDLRSKLRGVGFRIEESSHLGFFLYPPFALVKLKNRFFGNNEIEKRAKTVARDIKRFRHSQIMHGLMRLEAILRPHAPYAVGIRCLVTCRKP
jgi:SAM-dependent methyltransferase